jgi:hypothetical protein
LDLPYLSEKDGEFLKKVQQGLREGWVEQSAPLNRRSVELRRNFKNSKS